MLGATAMEELACRTAVADKIAEILDAEAAAHYGD
jgi:hypothetical protein